MNINPIDILLVAVLLLTMFFGYKNGVIIEFKKTVSLLGSIMLSNMIIKSLSNKFYFLKAEVDIFYLSTFLIILILLMLSISFIIDMVIEESEDLVIDKYANLGLGSLLGIIRGAIIISLLLFVFDTTPIEKDSKDSLYNKLQNKSILFKQFNNLKSLILDD